MNKKLPALIAVLLVFVSLTMFLQAYGAYETAKHLTQPNIDALSPELTSERVLSDVVPGFPASGPGASDRILVESLVDQAATNHKLAAVQANAQVRMAGIQAVAWGVVLLLSALLVLQLWPRRK